MLNPSPHPPPRVIFSSFPDGTGHECKCTSAKKPCATGLFFNTSEYNLKLIYKSLTILSCRNFHASLLPEQSTLRSLLLTVAPKVQVFRDSAGGEHCWDRMQPYQCESPPRLREVSAGKMEFDFTDLTQKPRGSQCLGTMMCTDMVPVHTNIPFRTITKTIAATV